jgi:hypothetical protein
MDKLVDGLSIGVVRPIAEPLWKVKQVAARLAVSVDWVHDHVSRKEPRLPVANFSAEPFTSRERATFRLRTSMFLLTGRGESLVIALEPVRGTKTFPPSTAQKSEPHLLARRCG